MASQADPKQIIQSAYSQYLKATGRAPRPGQKHMIAHLYRALTQMHGPKLVAVEAGTGTGKTLAYLVAGLAMAKSEGHRLIISTATVALQEQVLTKDLPELIEAVPELKTDYMLAKGRRRYICPVKLHEAMNESSQVGLSLGSSVSEREVKAFNLMRELADQLEGGQWDGEKDSLTIELEERAWYEMTVSSRECAGPRCRLAQVCPFLKARARLDKSPVIVVNHDLLLADLGLGGGVILPSPDDCLYVFDEAHHLDAKAIDQFAKAASMTSLRDLMRNTERLLADLSKTVPAVESLNRFIMSERNEFKLRNELLHSLDSLLKTFVEESGERRDNYRFERGFVPELIMEALRKVQPGLQEFSRVLDKANDYFREIIQDGHPEIARDVAEKNFSLTGLLLDAFNEALACIQLFLQGNDSDYIARWLEVGQRQGETDIILHASPTTAAAALSKNLWNRAAGAVLTSATLTSGGEFGSFISRNGLPKETPTHVVSSPFNFQEHAVLRVPADVPDGNRVDEHTSYLIEKLPTLLSESLGSLVLFASRAQMEEVFDSMPKSIQEQIQLQGQGSKQELLKEHKARIDQGKYSTLFGLASFSEGVDLPGVYLTHVLIAKIPFSTPDDPVAATRAEFIEDKGGNAFMSMTLPEAAVRFVQSCGRLLRQIDDRGAITVLDRRLVSKRYGSYLLRSLPPFKIDSHFKY